MKFLCDSCERLVEPAGVRVDAAALLLRCPRCEAESPVALPANVDPATVQVSTAQFSLKPAPTTPPTDRPLAVASAPRPPGYDAPAVTAPDALVPTVAAAPIPPEERCPKCATGKEGRPACVKCGLVFELYKPEEDVVPQSARRDFDQLLDTWGTPDSARLLAGLPVETVPYLGRLCRHRLADAPTDARAAGLLQKLHERTMALAVAATASEGIARQEGGSASSRGAVVAVAALGIVAALALLASLIHGLG